MQNESLPKLSRSEQEEIIDLLNKAAEQSETKITAEYHNLIRGFVIFFHTDRDPIWISFYEATCDLLLSNWLVWDFVPQEHTAILTVMHSEKYREVT